MELLDSDVALWVVRQIIASHISLGGGRTGETQKVVMECTKGMTWQDVLSRRGHVQAQQLDLRASTPALRSRTLQEIMRSDPVVIGSGSRPSPEDNEEVINEAMGPINSEA